MRASAAAAGLVRRRLSLPFLTIIAIGIAGAVLVGGGRPVSGHPAPATAISASIDGKPVQISGPAVALLQRQLASSNARHGGSRK